MQRVYIVYFRAELVAPLSPTADPHLEAVGEQVGVRGAPGQRAELDDADEARQVKHLALQVLAVA